MISSDFQDIMAPRRAKDDAFGYMSRFWNPQPAFKRESYVTPQELKQDVAGSLYMKTIIEQLSASTNVHPETLRKEMLQMLEEIGLDRKLHVIRWLGILTIKVLVRMKTGVFVNERNIFHLKSTMGHYPVIFLPTHRSYADFVLMTYVSFHYDIEFPAVAAGMDFHSMAIIGRAFRDTCAFYTRRTFAGAPLYAATFRRYVRALVTKNHTPIEFFVEGTRSRSNKTLLPKYGLLSMVLSPLLTQEVGDITIVPVNITYDRLLEQKLFAFEHLGVPKPKETTSGFLKALNYLNENFGNIYVNIGKTMSVKEFLGSGALCNDWSKPSELQEINKEQYGLIQNVALEVTHQQQQLSVVTPFNIVAIFIMKSLYDLCSINMDNLQKDVCWLLNIFRNGGANLVVENNVEIETIVKASFKIHSSLIKLDKKNNIKLTGENVIINDAMKNRLKGHLFSEEMMSFSIPIISLQLYINPVIHWMLPSSIIVALASKSPIKEANLYEQYQEIRKLLHFEFPIHEKTDLESFQKGLEFCLSEDAIILSDLSVYSEGSNKKLIDILSILIQPFLMCLRQVCHTFLKVKSAGNKDIIELVQIHIEKSLLSGDGAHPYCASLEVILNCLQSLTMADCITKSKQDVEFRYEIKEDKLKSVLDILDIPEKTMVFGQKNQVLLDRKSILARL